MTAFMAFSQEHPLHKIETMLSKTNIVCEEFYRLLFETVESGLRLSELGYQWPLLAISEQERRKMGCSNAYAVLEVFDKAEDLFESQKAQPVNPEESGQETEISKAGTLVVSAGLHGVEGRFGVLLQLEFLLQLAKISVGNSSPKKSSIGKDSLANWLPGRTKVLFIFVTNETGFFQARRWSSTNSDLNRSFEAANIAPSLEDKLILSEFYKNLGPSAQNVSPLSFARFACRALRKYGFKKLFKVLPKGQNIYSDFIFFTGNSNFQSEVGTDGSNFKGSPTSFSDPNAAKIANLLQYLFSKQEQIVHVDLHTGLGGFAELSVLGSSGIVTKEVSTGQEFYKSAGGFVEWCSLRFCNQGYEGCYAEFGTFSSLRVFFSLIQENWSFQNAHPANEAHRQQLVNIFFPKSRAWRKKTIIKGVALLHRLLSLQQKNLARGS